jgi:WD40 repeat protein
LVTGLLPPAHAAPIGCVAFRVDGLRLASGSADRSVIVWDVTGRAITEFGLPAAAAGAAWNPGATTMLAVGCADGTLTVWRADDERPPALMKVLGNHPAAITAVRWLPDGQHLLCVLADGRAVGWNVFDETFLGETTGCAGLDVSVAGLVAEVQGDGGLSVRDPWRDAVPVRRQLAATALACAWSPSGERLAVAGPDGAVEVFDPALVPVGTVRTGDGPLHGVAWSDDGRRLFTGAADLVTALDLRGNVLWRRTDELLRPDALAAGAGLVAVGSSGDRPYLLTQPDGSPMLAPRR